MNVQPQPSHGLALSDSAQLACLIERGRLGEASKLLTKLLGEWPEDPAVLVYAAYIDYLEDRNQAALETLQRALAIDPNHELARHLLFKLYDEGERNAEAERVIMELLRDYPEQAYYYAEYAKLMLRALHLEKAGALAEQAIRLDPDDGHALLVAALCAFVSDPTSEADRRLQVLIRRYPDAAQTIAAMVSVLMQQGKPRAAQRLAQELHRAYPDNEHIVDAVVLLKVQNHWSIKPLWPIQRFGWAGCAALWFALLGGFVLLQQTPLAHWQGALFFALLTYAIYSWVYPPLLAKLLRR